MEFKVDQFQYEFKAPKRTLFSRVRNIYSGISDGRGVLKQFEIDNNIDRSDELRVVATRKKYYIRTHRVELIADERDRTIHQEVMKLDKKQRSIAGEIERLATELNRERAILASYSKQLNEITDELQKESLTPLEKAHLQGDQGTVESSMDNQSAVVTRLEANITSLRNVQHANQKLFLKFQKEVDSEYEAVLNEYLQRAGRLLHGIGFTNFDAQLRDVSGHIKELIEESRRGI